MSSTRQLAAMMFADIVGYTALMQNDEQNALKLINRFKDVLEKIITNHQGRIVQYFGDGCLLAFDSSTNAVKCAVELQKAFSESPQVPVRIGIHLGDVLFKNENAFGDGVNIASRIETLGIPGAILLSKSIRDQVKNQKEFQLTSLGSFDFKNVNESIEVFAISNPGIVVPKPEEMQGKLKKKNVRKRNLIAATAFTLVLITSFFIYQKFFNNKDPEQVSEKSIAVLPFVNMSDDEDQEYFSDGMMEEILNQLAKISELKVSSRTTSMLFRNSKKPLKEIANTLGVANILEGSVRKSNDKIRITVQLIDAETDIHLWSETFDMKIDDVFAIQTDIATQIARTLKAKLSPEEEKHIAKKTTENIEAYQLYLKGRYYWNQRKSESFSLGIEHFKLAIEKDSLYALAYAGLGDSYLMLGVYGLLRPDESFPVAKKYIEKSLQLDPTLAEAYASLSDINIHYDWNNDAAEENFNKAVKFNPLYANAFHWHSEVLVLRKQFEKSFGESEAALKIEPYSLSINTQLGANYVYAGEMQKAIEQLNKTIGYDSTNLVSHHYIGIAYIALKQLDKALFHLNTANELSPDNTRILSTLGYAEAMSGKKVAALKIEKRLLALTKKKYVPPFDLAVIETGLGNNKEALQYLEQELKDRGPWMPFISMIPLFNPLKEDPAFLELIKKVEKSKK